MGEATSIEWCHHTFNPWWGCVKVSDACKFCYAESLAKRYGHAVWGHRTPRRFFGEAHWREPRKWNRSAAERGVRERVFCASMADIFEIHGDPEVDVEMSETRERLWALIAETPSLDWLLLTKRPGNVPVIVPAQWEREPPKNVWLGVTAEDQENADERIPLLLSIPWPGVRFVSYEPALGPITFHPGTLGCVGHLAETFGNPLIHWLIVGGESGGGARPFDLAWARSAVRQAKAARIPVLVKQLGGRPIATCGWCRGDGIDPVLVEGTDPDWCSECGGAAGSLAPERLVLKKRKGNDMAEWPADLRVREFPEVHRG